MIPVNDWPICYEKRALSNSETNLIHLGTICVTLFVL